MRDQKQLEWARDWIVRHRQSDVGQRRGAVSALEIAESCIILQIAKEPERCNIDLCARNHCPSCNYGFLGERNMSNFCPDCGQKIDWEKINKEEI
jgi:hypothetical protein